MSPLKRSTRSLYFNDQAMEFFPHNIHYTKKKKSAQYSIPFCFCQYILAYREQNWVHSLPAAQVFSSLKSPIKDTHIPFSENPHSSLNYLSLLRVHHTHSGPHFTFLWLRPDQEMSGIWQGSMSLPALFC